MYTQRDFKELTHTIMGGRQTQNVLDRLEDWRLLEELML